MKSVQSEIFSGSAITLTLAALLIAFTGLKSEPSFAATRISDLSEIAYYEMLREQGIEPQKALAQGEDCSPRSEMSHKVGIIGQDRRRRLSAQEEQDYSGVVAIYSEKAGYTGSGFLVCDGSVVLTNAHIFYHNSGELRSNFGDYELYASNKAGDFQKFSFDPSPSARVVGATSGFTDDPSRDWVLIRLRSTPDNRKFKPLKVRAQPETIQVANQATSGISVVGFLNGDNWNRYLSPCLNFRSTGAFRRFTLDSVRFYSNDCSTEGGASGSPVIQGSCKGAPQAIAVHATGVKEEKSSFNNFSPDRNNVAVPINQEILDGMRRLCGKSFWDAVCPPQDHVARH